MSLLEVRNVHQYFGGVKALNGVSFDVEAGKTTCLIGPNGAGKTTLFNVITGLIKPTSGSIAYCGRDITGLAPHAVARLGIGRTFQDPRVFRNMTVLENVVVGVPQRSAENAITALLQLPSMRRERDAAIKTAEAMLEFVGLADKRNEAAWSLSYGQQRFLSLARTLATNADIILMDEPTVGLDTTGREALLGLIAKTVKQESKTVLLVEHNMDVVMDISDLIVLMIEGKQVAAGTPEDMKRNPLMLEAYLGVRYATATV